MTTGSESNKDTLIKAIDLFRNAMRDFLVRHLDGANGLSVEEAVRSAYQNFRDERILRDLQNHIDAKKPIVDFIDVFHFKQLLVFHWNTVFRPIFGDKDIQDDCWNIVTIRNKTHHPGRTLAIGNAATRMYLLHMERALRLIDCQKEQTQIQQMLERLTSPEVQGLEAEVGQLSVKLERHAADFDEKIEGIVHEYESVIRERDDILEAHHDALAELGSIIESMPMVQQGPDAKMNRLKRVVAELNATLTASGEVEARPGEHSERDVPMGLDDQSLENDQNPLGRDNLVRDERVAYVAEEDNFVIDGESYVSVGDKEIIVDLMINDNNDQFVESDPPLAELNRYEKMVVKREMRRLLNAMPTARFYCTRDKCVFSDGKRQSWYNEHKAAEHERVKRHKVRDLDE